MKALLAAALFCVTVGPLLANGVLRPITKTRTIYPSLPRGFAYIAAFSGAGNRTEWEKADPAMLNQKLKVLWLGCGTEDLAYNGVKGMHDLFEQKKVKHVWNPSGGGHSWPNWQVYLSKYAPLLFRE